LVTFAHAQQQAMPVIGFLASASAEPARGRPSPQLDEALPQLDRQGRAAAGDSADAAVIRSHRHSTQAILETLKSHKPFGRLT
jgi:hypothetical protein